MPRLCWSVQSGYAETRQLAPGPPQWAEVQLLQGEKCNPKRLNPSLTRMFLERKGQFFQRQSELLALFLLLHPKEMKGKPRAKITAECHQSFPRNLWSLFLAERGLLQFYVNCNMKAVSAQDAEN